MPQPLVSVIVPAYNAAGFISRCVESITSQSYPELEILLLNDGSTDDTAAVCARLAAQDPRIAVIATPNTGAADTRTQGIRLAAQVEVLLGWHKLQDRRSDELPFQQRLKRTIDRILLRRAYEKAVQENPAPERLFEQEQEQAIVQMNLNAKNYTEVAEPMSNIYGALYSTLATDENSQRKSMRYIGSCIGRVFYLLDKAGRVADDKRAERYNVYLVNGVEDPGAALENARRQSLAAANDLVRAYGMLDVKLNKSLIDNIMILGLRHAVEPLDPENQPVRWELP